MSTTQTKPAAKPAQQPPAEAPDTSTAIAIVEDLATKYALGQLKAKGKLERAIILARGIQELRKAVAPLMPQIMPLMNTRLGFLTDKDPQRTSKPVTPYGEQQVRECLIEALLRGLYPVGNEFNIISGSCYTTKEGYERLVRELPGLTDFEMSKSVPKMSEGGAVIRVRAAWKYEGRPMSLKDEQGMPGVSIPVRLNAGMGVDAALGKAERKAYALVYKLVTGTVHTDGAADEPADVPLVTTAAQLPEPVGRPAQEALRPRGNGTPKDATPLEYFARLTRELRLEEHEVQAYLAEYQVHTPQELTEEQLKELATSLGERLAISRDGQAAE